MASPVPDYLIVGAGSAGAALAARLSEDPAVRVHLLEAGPDYRAAETPAAMRIPNSTSLQREPAYAQFRWPALLARRTSVQEPRYYMRGRGLGGSSAVNGQVAIRGLLEDFDKWSALGCVGWSGAEVLPAFIRLEDDRDFGDAPFHGRGGPIPIERAPIAEWGAVDRALRIAALELGYPWHDDANAPTGTGVSPFAINSRNSERVSTNDGYLEPARARPNLTITGQALVDRVVFAGRRAVGVRVRLGDDWTVLAGERIVLCAGAIHSPAILMRSGIGPASDLTALGIAVLHDGPVGHNLLDHAAVHLNLQLRPSARASTVAARTTNCCLRYSSDLAGAGVNDMLIRGWNLDGHQPDHLARGHIMVSAYEYFSRGQLQLVATDPDVQPMVDFRMLSDERDLVRMRDGLRRLVAILRDPAIAAIADEVEPVALDGAPIDLADDAAVDRWLLRHCHDVAHAAGTCRMGDPGDPRSVVDPDCQVLGVEGLAVVDAAIMPEIPRANLHLSAVMLGEHVAARWRGR